MIARDRESSDTLSEFIRYLANNCKGDGDRLPALADLGQQLGISVASLREQLEVARALGMVEVRPRTGIRPLPYSFAPAVKQSLAYAIAIEPDHFHAYSDLRNHIETAYWFQAVSMLLPEDHQRLKDLVAQAFEKLHGNRIQIPHAEHRELHLLIYARLNNPFVIGLLETYWEMYEAVGLSLYTDYNYLERVWQYHQRMVDAICAGDANTGYKAMMEHADLLYQRSRPLSRQKFE